MSEKISLIELKGPLSVRKQCELLTLNRSSYYLEPRQESEENVLLMGLIDKLYTAYPFFGSRKMRIELSKLRYEVSRKRVQRLMRLMGLEVIYRRPKLSKIGEQPKKFSYLLRGVSIERPNHAWGIDITYIPVLGGFLYLVAVIDWYSRYILAWKLSNSMDISFCLEVAREALKVGVPEIMNSDQGSQFTSQQFVEIFESLGVKISWDGIGRAIDNIFVERFWRSLKYEEVYLKQYNSGKEALQGIGAYIAWYNNERSHQSLDYKTPQEVFLGVHCLKESVIIRRRQCL
jgi:putative transposase